MSDITPSGADPAQVSNLAQGDATGGIPGGGTQSHHAPPAGFAPDPGTQSHHAPPSIFSEGLAFTEGRYEGVKDPAFDPYRSMAAQFKDLPTVFKSLHDTKAALSQRTDGMVKLPTANSSPEEVAAYHRAIGVPETADAYEITPPAQLPEGVDFAPESLQGFKEFAVKHGIPPATANALIAFQAQAEGEAISQIREAHQERVQAEQAQLQREWGMKYEQNLMLAKRAAETFGMKADHPAMRNPDVLKAMAFAASKISESSLVSGEKLGGMLSPGSEARDIMANPDNPLYAAYHTSGHPNHEYAVSTYMLKMKEQVQRDGFQV